MPGPQRGFSLNSERCNQGHQKPKKPKSFQKWQKYGFIKLKLKVHPLVTFYFRFCNTIFTSDNPNLYDRQLKILKILGIVTVTHPGFISDVKNIYLLTSLLFVHIMNSKSRNQVRLIWHFHNSDIFQNRSDIHLEYSHQKKNKNLKYKSWRV